jgi:hypothetical protein
LPDLSVAIRVVRSASVDADRLSRLRCCRQTNQQKARHDSKKLVHTSSSKDRFEYRELLVIEAGEGVFKESTLQPHGHFRFYGEAKQLLVRTVIVQQPGAGNRCP